MNRIVNAAGDGLFFLLGWMHPVLAILVLGTLTAAGSLVVFRWTSDQEGIRAAKGPMKAHLLGILLFRHDLRQVFRALGIAFWRSLTNLRFLLVPLAVMILPLVLLFVQLEIRLGARGLRPGETAVLRVLLAEGASLDDVTLAGSAGVRVETPGVRVSAGGAREVDFRIRITEPGIGKVTARAAGREVEKRITALPGLRPLSAVRPDSGLLSRLLHPSEPPLPGGSPVRSIEVRYPAVTYAFLGIDWAWWVLFLLFMVLALYVLKGPLGVDF